MVQPKINIVLNLY